jgi:hypothetical protein
MPWGQAGEGAELGRGRETPSRAHGGDQGGTADGGQAGQAAGKCERVDPAVPGLPLDSVPVQLDLEGAQQPDLGVDFGGQILEGTAGCSPDSSSAAWAAASHWAARAAPCWPWEALAIRRPAELGQQQPGCGVGVALEHGQVGQTQLASEWRHRQELTDQVLDAALVGSGLLGEPVTGPHPAVQRARGASGSWSGCSPAGSTSGRRARVSASMELALACRWRNRRRSWAQGPS